MGKKKRKKKKQQITYGWQDGARYVVYTDGGCSFNPGGKGGYAAVITDTENGTVTELSGSMSPTTNNRMEIYAVIAALETIPEGETVLVYSDSQYFVLTAAGIWNGTKNYDLWKRYKQLVKNKKIGYRWVRGHNGDVLNERCDELATLAIESIPPLPDPGFDPAEFYKTPMERGTIRTGSMAKKIDIPEDYAAVFVPDGKERTVSETCRNGIEALMKNENPSFRDYSGLKTGGRDGWSSVKKDVLIGMFGEETYAILADHLGGSEKACLTAMRWMGRGLSLYHAIRRQYVDDEITANYLDGRRKYAKKR